MSYIWDTNICIYFLQELFPKTIESNFIKLIEKNKKPSISFVTELELLCWKTETSKDIEIIKEFISDSEVLEINQDIKDKTVEIRKKTAIKLPDALIAATCIVNNYILLSRNSKDFSKIVELKMVNPFDL